MRERFSKGPKTSEPTQAEGQRSSQTGVPVGLAQLRQMQQSIGNQASIRLLKTAGASGLPQRTNSAPIQMKPIGFKNELGAELDTDQPEEILTYVNKLLGKDDGFATAKEIERKLKEMEEDVPEAKEIAKEIRRRLANASIDGMLNAMDTSQSTAASSFNVMSAVYLVDQQNAANTNLSPQNIADDGGKAEMIKLLKGFTLPVFIRDKPQDLNIGDYFESPKKSKHNYFPELDIRDAVAKKLKEIKGTNPEAEMALYWAEERLTPPVSARSSGGGGGKVTVKATANSIEIGGRPGFETEAQELPGMLDDYHRRHVIAWHSIKSTVANVAKYVMRTQTTDEGFKGLSTMFTKLYKDFGIEAALAQKKVELETKLALKENALHRKQLDKIPDLTTMNETKKLETVMQLVLSHLNSNIKNLWPGEGYENSLINTYQSVLRAWAGEVDSIDADKLGTWASAKAKELKERTDANGGRFKSILTNIHEMIGQWEQAKSLELDAKKAWEECQDTAQKSELEKKYKLAQAFDLKKVLLNAADSYEVDWPYKNESGKDDQAHLKRNNKQVNNNLLKIAGRFLDWSENKGDIFTKDVNESLHQLDTLLRQFMDPALAGGGEEIPK
ncbi:hypothetical protein [Paenibacillus sp. HB172176]|uniref:hypothetical protein n=1 Tax=Paenibacillus sp. HB172176 TaxID=2493690 RepID=UPI00143BBCAB|nr:hypothetical protein [Paenibacillus sp. HB172176]